MRSSIFDFWKQDMKLNTQKVVNEVYEFMGMEKFELETVAPSNTRSYKTEDVVSEETKEKLKVFYEPWNRELDETMIEMGFNPPRY